MSVRDLGMVAWRDPDANLESMRGPAWTRAIREEAARFAKHVNNPTIMARLPAYRASLRRARCESKNYLYTAQGRLFATIIDRGNAGIEWSVNNSKPRPADDIDVAPDGQRFFTVEDVGAGAHMDDLICRDPKGRVLWKKRDVGLSVACVGERVYYLRPLKKLWYHECWSCDAATGDDERLEYEERNPTYNLALLKEAGRTLYLYADNNGYSHLQVLQPNGRFEPIDLDAIYHVPSGGGVRAVLTVAGRWYLRGPLGETNLPYEPYFYDASTKLALVREEGVVRGFIGHRKVFEFPGGRTMPDGYKLWSTGAVSLIVETPTIPQAILNVGCDGTWRLIRRSGGGRVLSWKMGTTRSADGTVVPFGWASMVARPRALLVYMYGAYGLPTLPGNVRERWGPLLEAGWAVGYAFVRGGGDNGWAWAEAGRRTGRIRTIEDAEACVAALRLRCGVDAAHTAIYGRSAGGILMGTLANRHVSGNLFGMVYAEVPYVDVLQTATNPSLPLTELEYDEFGDPAHRLEDLAFWVRFSPVPNVPADGIPALKVLCRSGVNDTQVYAYEPLKWVRRLRGKDDESKLLALADGEGHFYGREAALEAEAVDMAILDAWTWP